MRTESKDVEKILKALANGRRLSILRFLKSGQQASVGQIAEHIRLSFKSTSNHLLILAAAGVLKRKQASTTVLYEIHAPQSQLVKVLLHIL